MRIFLDTEFTNLGQSAQLISIGLVGEGDALFYGEFTDYDPEEATPWVREHVLPLLSGNRLSRAGFAHKRPTMLVQGDTFSISRSLRSWFSQWGGPKSVQIWADVLAWDWVLFCEVFGGAFFIPEQIHYMPMDLATLLWSKGIDPDTTREELGQVQWSHPKLHLAKHHALYDALLEREVFGGVFSF